MAERTSKTTKKADGEAAVLAAIASMGEADRSIGERLHALITGSAPALQPKTYYGMPAYAKDGKSSASSGTGRSSRSGTSPSALTTSPASTRGTCGRSTSR
jgi:hypothetical protein